MTPKAGKKIIKLEASMTLQLNCHSEAKINTYEWRGLTFSYDGKKIKDEANAEAKLLASENSPVSVALTPEMGPAMGEGFSLGSANLGK